VKFILQMAVLSMMNINSYHFYFLICILYKLQIKILCVLWKY
jgi:hypothetical protein